MPWLSSSHLGSMPALFFPGQVSLLPLPVHFLPTPQADQQSLLNHDGFLQCYSRAVLASLSPHTDYHIFVFYFLQKGEDKEMDTSTSPENVPSASEDNLVKLHQHLNLHIKQLFSLLFCPSKLFFFKPWKQVETTPGCVFFALHGEDDPLFVLSYKTSFIHL